MSSINNESLECVIIPPEIQNLVKIYSGRCYVRDESQILQAIMMKICPTASTISEVTNNSINRTYELLERLYRTQLIQFKVNGGNKHYFIDYNNLIHRIESKLSAMKEHYEKQLRDDLKIKNILCTTCEKLYNHVNVHEISTKIGSELKCGSCTSVIIENTYELDGPVQDMAFFNMLVAPINIALDKAKTVIIPIELINPTPTDI